MKENAIHEGRNVKRIREIMGIKQEVLAIELGISQQAVSSMEQREALDRDMLEKVAKALKVTPEAIKSFSDETAINIISNNFSSHDTSTTMNAVNCYPTFHPIDKLVEAMEENKKLYEQLLQSERDKIALLEKMLNNK